MSSLLSLKEKLFIVLGIAFVMFGAYLAVTAHTGSQWSHLSYAATTPGSCVQQDVFAPKGITGDALIKWATDPDNANHVKPAMELACSGGFGNVTLG